MADFRNLPRKLYRYRSKKSEHFWTDLLTAIKDRSVWVHPVTHQNDPFDSAPAIGKLPPRQIRDFLKVFFERHPGKSITGTDIESELQKKGVKKSEIRKYTSSTLDAARLFSESVLTAYKEDHKNHCISCFSDRDDSIVMWSHYADNHEGICIEFTANSRPVFRDISMIDYVKYQDSRPIITDLDLMKYIGCMHFEGDNLFDKSIIDRIIDSTAFTKSKDWRYENEWRLSSRTYGSKFVSISPIHVSTVLIGARMPRELEDNIRQKLEEFPDVRVQRMKLSDEDFSIQRK